MDFDDNTYTQPNRTNTMDIDAPDDGHLDDTELDDAQMDVEEALDNLDELDNHTQLIMLKKEINHYTLHGIEPAEGWYDERFRIIQTYSELNWYDLVQKFHGKDDYIHDSAILIMRMCYDLLEECSTKPNFHLKTYYRLLHTISNMWQYYQSNYLEGEGEGEGEREGDTDMDNLIKGLAQMMR